MNTEPSPCPKCGRPLNADSLMGLCPECLLSAGFPTGAGTGGGRFEPPTPAELAASTRRDEEGFAFWAEKRIIP